MHSPLAISHISLSQSASSGYQSASRSNGSRMFDAESPSATSAAKDFLYQRALAPNAVPLLVRLQRPRILGSALLGVGVITGVMALLRRGIVLKSFQISSNSSKDVDVDAYNFYVGMCTSLVVKPLLALVTAVAPAVLLCFLTQVAMQERSSRRTRFALALLGNVVFWLLCNGFMALYASQQPVRVESAIGDSDLVDYSSLQAATSDGGSSMDTILRSAMLTRDATASTSEGQCSRPSPRRLPAQLDFGFPAHSWLSNMLPFAPETTSSNTLKVALGDGIEGIEDTTLPMNLTTAHILVTSALRATDDFFREQGVAANAGLFELGLPKTFDTGSSTNGTMTQALIEATNASMTLAFDTRDHLRNFSVLEAQLEFVKFPWTSDTGALVFEGVTLEIPMDTDFLRRDVKLSNDTTQSVLYGDQAQRGVFEINAKEECGRNGCVVSPVGAVLSTAPADEGSQVRALPICVDATTGLDDYEATLNVNGTECEQRSNHSVLILSFAKRIEGDAIRSSQANDSTGVIVTLSNARKIYQVTAGRLSWTPTDLATAFHASCQAGDCSGLAFPLSDSGRQVLVGNDHLPLRNLTMYTPSVSTWLPLVTSNVQEVDMSDILKSDFVFPRNFADSNDWIPVDGARCERERGVFLDRVEGSHLFSERALQPAYQSALFWLFQHGVVHQKASQTSSSSTLEFDASITYVDVTLSVPEISATLTFVGCALLLVLSVLVFLGGKGREADIERHFKPHHLARVLLNDDAFSHRLLKCDLLNVGNKYLDSSELLDQFEISGLALRHRDRPADVLIVPKGQSSATSSAASSQHMQALV
ncbi:hypothetical protein BBJ28_00003311 [Nothophytophthora sp. Chile5]|nr:hypothetical protein BBJ28_00003311 [Nothophytophthora sp. Chile5]